MSGVAVSGCRINRKAFGRKSTSLLLLCSLSTTACLAASDRPATASPNANACATLAGMKVESGEVNSAEPVAPDVCRVRAKLRPAPSSDIDVEVWLPRNWNRKLYSLGGAGFDGGLQPGSLPSFEKAAAQGYAVAATDSGHEPAASFETWVHRQPEKVVDFGHRAVHLAAVAAKQIVAAYYGSPPKHAYFVGCSNGGREALMEASRYPDDYDGIIAGAPAMRYLEVLTQMIWFDEVVFGEHGAPTALSKLGLVNRAILNACDGVDGAKDGILENPLECRFDPAELRCEDEAGDECLTAAEVSAFQKIYGGPRLRSGEPVFAGPALGSEEGPAGWAGWIVPDRTVSFGQDFYRWLVFDDPDWTVESFDIDRDYPYARERIAPILDSNDPDLRAFAKRNGKLILYHGWYDPGRTGAHRRREARKRSRVLAPVAPLARARPLPRLRAAE
ncbi:MAG TPA: tannase/feruloyl esterase family alpha/beta hydrolase [Pseudomonadales bacterium]